MTESTVTDHELSTYLDELLSVDRMAEIEKQLRASDTFRLRLANLAQRRDQGMHSVGEIWRQARLSCPTRSQLGSHLLDALPPELNDYVTFHLQTIGCRYCAANLGDLEHEQQATPEKQQRRQKYFQSSAGYLSRTDND